MWLFWLYEFLGFVAVISLIVAYCRIRKQRFWSFTWKYLKWILLSIVGVLLVIAILCRHDLYNATHCYFRGVSMHAQTKYSIYLGECQVETPSGSYIPIDRTEALLGSNDHGNGSSDHGNNDGGNDLSK